jgi:hypothetical protein
MVCGEISSHNNPLRTESPGCPAASSAFEHVFLAAVISCDQPPAIIVGEKQELRLQPDRLRTKARYLACRFLEQVLVGECAYCTRFDPQYSKEIINCEYEFALVLASVQPRLTSMLCGWTICFQGPPNHALRETWEEANTPAWPLRTY